MTKIFLAGHRGMVGGAILRQLLARGEDTVLIRSRAELDLTNQAAVHDFMHSEKPDVVILAAARVGGIMANNSFPADFIYDNLMIAANVIHQTFLAGAKGCCFWDLPAFTRERSPSQCAKTRS